MSCSNATVERGFSDLTNIMTDRRLSLSHESMEMMLMIKINDYSWSDSERSSIINEATERYLKKRRFTSISHASSPHVDDTRRDENDEGDSESASAYSSCVEGSDSDEA